MTESAASTRGPVGSLLLGLVMLLGSLAIGFFGVSSAWAAWTAERAPANVAIVDASTAARMVVAASARGEAEAAILRRVTSVTTSENVVLRSSAFKPAQGAGALSMVFDLEGSPSAVWRSIHAIETGVPAIVFTRFRATTRDQGARLSVSADAIAAWADFSPESEEQASRANREAGQ